MNTALKNTYYQNYLAYMTAIMHGFITHNDYQMLSKAARDFEIAVDDVIDLKNFGEDELLLESMSQLTFGLHQLAKSGFSADVRGMLHHPLEDILNHIVHYLGSLDQVAQNDPMLFIIEDEIDSIEDIRNECITSHPRDAHALSVLLCHLKDMAMCLHSLNV